MAKGPSKFIQPLPRSSRQNQAEEPQDSQHSTVWKLQVFGALSTRLSDSRRGAFRLCRFLGALVLEQRLPLLYAPPFEAGHA